VIGDWWIGGLVIGGLVIGDWGIQIAKGTALYMLCLLSNILEN
jgi:hypothetical protein